MEPFRCLIHGSFRYLPLIHETHQIFTTAGIEVLAPSISTIVGVRDGFALLEGEEADDPRVVELRYLSNLNRLGPNGFSYFVNPEGALGRSAAYELGIVQSMQTRAFFLKTLQDLPATLSTNCVWPPRKLADYIATHGQLPPGRPIRGQQASGLAESVFHHGPTLAAGAVIVQERKRGEPRILVVQTHQWGGKWSLIGTRPRRGEDIYAALVRGITSETGLRVGSVGDHLCTFQQLDRSAHNPSADFLFVDYEATAGGRVRLNEQAEGYLWVPPRVALAELDLEPNATRTIRHYVAQCDNRLRA